MPRTARASAGGYCDHVLNRGNARSEVFHEPADYAAFTATMAEADLRVPMRRIAHGLMPNHFHLVLWPRADGDLSRWMHWLLTTHVRRYLKRYGHSGHVWQGRFKAFPIQEDDHLRMAIHYVERNPSAPPSWTAPRPGPGPAWRPRPRAPHSTPAPPPTARAGSSTPTP